MTIGEICTLAGVVISAVVMLTTLLRNSRNDKAGIIRLEDKVDELDKKVAKHNSVIERTYKLEGQMLEVQHDIRDLKNK